jgi:MSHA biogenesis protein MshM
VALYLDHFGLNEAPFRITPHTDFFFEGAERGAMLEALAYAVLHDEGIVKVSGEVGSGKTMLCRMLMERLPAEVATIYLATPSLARDEILHAIADDLELKLPERRTVALRELQEHLITLYGAGRRVVILIDEAHVMPDDTLEQVRLLSNLETATEKLLQIVLTGQPELRDLLAGPELAPLRQRIALEHHIERLRPEEIGPYLRHRIEVAGARFEDLFVPGSEEIFYAFSAGCPRLVNLLADRALLAGFSRQERPVKSALLERKAKEMAEQQARNPLDPRR